jgi:hypothetical protein
LEAGKDMSYKALDQNVRYGMVIFVTFEDNLNIPQKLGALVLVCREINCSLQLPVLYITYERGRGRGLCIAMSYS